MTPASTCTPNALDFQQRWRSARRVGGIVLVVGFAVLYGLTLDNGLQPGELHGGDLITHQYAQVQARPSNAPGYPLYTMGGWLWFHSIRIAMEAIGIAYPNPIPILSSYSTVWALIALWLLYEIICLVTSKERKADEGAVLAFDSTLGNWPVAFLVSSFYGVSYFFWYYATTTEQYSSAIAHTLAILFVFLVWLRHQESLRLLFALAFLCGLSLAHMLTVALIVPPIVVAVLWLRPRLLTSPKAIAGSVVAVVLPLASYAFVYVRGSQHPEWWGSQDFSSPSDWFWNFVSTAQGREELMWAFEPGRPFLGNGFPQLIGQELTWIVVIAGLMGIAFLRKPLPFVLYATIVIYLLFSWAYRFGNWFQVILPAYALLMIGVAGTADRWQTFAACALPNASRHYQLVRSFALSAPLILLIIALVWRFDASYVAADSRNRPDDTALDRAAILLDGPLPYGSALFASVDDALALQYLTEIWGVRPDVSVVSSDVARERIEEQPIFVTWDAAATLREEIGSAEDIALSVLSPDWVVVATGGHQGPDNWSTPKSDRNYVNRSTEIAPGLVLAGYEVRPAPDGEPVLVPQSPDFDVTLYWQLPPGGWPDDLAISVRPTLEGDYIRDPENPSTIKLTDHARPVQLLFDDRIALESNSEPTIIVDPYRLSFPREFGAQGPGFAVVVYRRVEGGFEDVARLDFPVGADLPPN